MIVCSFLFIVDFAWLTDASIVSCSKDGKLIYEGIQKTVKPADKAVRSHTHMHAPAHSYIHIPTLLQTPVGLSINTDCNLAHACGDYVSHRSHGTTSLK